MKKENNITGLNTKITVLSDIIQNARITLTTDNGSISFSSDDTRRIILVCLLLLCKEKAVQFSRPINLFEMLDLLNISDNGFITTFDGDLQQIDLTGTTNVILSILQYPNWSDLLNYALEALEYDTNEYFNVDVSRGTRRENKKKKSHGIYYTPVDVVDFMVSRCISSVLPASPFPTILDCSCGAGAFLLQSLKYLDRKLNPTHNFDTSLVLLKKCIWGIDISPAAIDCCKAVFLQYYLDEYSYYADRLSDVWLVLDHSLFVGDATQLHKVQTVHEEFPATFDCIIGNPPYVSIGKDSNLFIPFVENMMMYSSIQSCSALVLPLSVCYSQGKKYVDLRERMTMDNGVWTFLNYDRSPDSLFGDQVKARNTILYRNTCEHGASFFTTKLQRWTSDRRDELFEKYKLCDISDCQISKYIPKISSSLEKQAFATIAHGLNGINKMCGTRRGDYPLVINGTAYNWICAYDHIPPSTDEIGDAYLSNTTKVYYLPDEVRRDFCIALLSNRIAYWYWAAIGDGFHLNASFLSEYRINWDNFTPSQQNELSHLGRAYSQCVKEHPTVSFNAGKRIVNYSHWDAMDIIQHIEKIIIGALNLPTVFASYIEQWYINQVYCNRDNEMR